ARAYALRGRRALQHATARVRDFPCPGGADSRPYAIAVGTDGRIWYDESGKDEMVAFDPATERVALTVPIPTKGSVVRNVAVDSTRARLWLAEAGVQRIGRLELKQGAGVPSGSDEARHAPPPPAPPPRRPPLQPPPRSATARPSGPTATGRGPAHPRPPEGPGVSRQGGWRGGSALRTGASRP